MNRWLGIVALLATGWMLAGALAMNSRSERDDTADMRRESAHTVGCAMSDITVRDRREAFDHATWIATCRGRDFTCGVHGFHRVGCAPRPPAR